MLVLVFEFCLIGWFVMNVSRQNSVAVSFPLITKKIDRN